MNRPLRIRVPFVLGLAVLLAPLILRAAGPRGFQPEDLYQLQSVTDLRLSPDGKAVAFVVASTDRKQNRRLSTIWMASSDGTTPAAPFTTVQSSRNPRWSPDGKALAFVSARPDADSGAGAAAPRAQVYVLRLDRAGEARKVTSLREGVEDFSWSPDGRAIACLSRMSQAVQSGPDSAVRGDVRHYQDSWYKEDGSGYDDGARGQVVVVDVASGAARQLTAGDDRSVTEAPVWSPDGTTIAFVARRTQVNTADNLDVWAVRAGGGPAVRVSDTGARVTGPRWSPDGTRIAYIGAQDWNAIPKIRIAPVGGGASTVAAPDLTFMTDLDWSADGRSLYATVPLKGEEHLVRVDVAAGTFAQVTSGPRVVRRVDVNEAAGMIAYAAGDVSHPDELFVAGLTGRGERQVSRLNAGLLAALDLPGAERMTFEGPDGWEVDGFLIKPVGWQAGRSYPMILNIHGGPNGMFGLHWNPDFQAQAARGYAVFYTNPRGSSGYGERFQRGVATEWGGKAYLDLMAGVDAALARFPWIDAWRLGVVGHSYGGFMTDWIVGHTDRFKGAVSLAGISDFVSVEGTRDGFYGHAKDFGGDLFEAFETYWNTSPLKFAPRVKTPTLLLHGEADNRVPALQSEEFFRALRHVGVTSELVLFPREPHSLRREPRHQVDVMEWTLYWFNRFVDGNPAAVRPSEGGGEPGPR
jgi:dipeptidyl aminopeptidase/acylaminoacyl peptidase